MSKLKMIVSYTKNNLCFKNAIRIKPTGLMLHSVGCHQPKASVFIKQFDNATISKAVHAFIDAETGTVYQCLPWTYKAWHCGGTGNSTTIGVEMCEPPAGGGQDYFERAYSSAVKLFAYLCKEYSIKPEAIVGHYEAHKKGIASNHADPEPLFKRFGKTMTDFRNDVRKAL